MAKVDGTEIDEGEEEAPLPGVVGAALAVTNSKPFQSLFGPALEVYGKYWGERAQYQADNWRKSRVANQKDHIEAVKQKEGELDPATLNENRIRQFAEWASTAEQVNGESDEELAALWRALLGRIINNDLDATDLLIALQQLNSRDAHNLLSMDPRRSRPKEIDEESYDRLAKVRLFKKRTIVDTLSQSPFGAALIPMMIFIAVATALVTAGFQFGMQAPVERVQVPIILLMIVTVLAAVAALTFTILREVGKYRLTAKGKKLRKFGLIYVSEPGPPDAVPKTVK